MSENEARENEITGFQIDPSGLTPIGIGSGGNTQNTLGKNTAVSNEIGFHLLPDSGSKLTKNRASQNFKSGFVIVNSTKVILRSTRAENNGNHGISLLRSSQNVLMKNTALNNNRRQGGDFDLAEEGELSSFECQNQWSHNTFTTSNLVCIE